MKFLQTLFAPLLGAAVALATLLPVASHAQESKPVKSGYLSVNGVNYHYQVHGKGEPLLLLHGGLGQFEMFGPVLARLVKTRQVIGVDLYGHGRTALTDRPVSLIDMGEDMAQIIQQLGYGQFHWELLFAATVMVTLPMIIIFFLAQKQFIQGIATTGLKG